MCFKLSFRPLVAISVLVLRYQNEGGSGVERNLIGASFNDDEYQSMFSRLLSPQNQVPTKNSARMVNILVVLSGKLTSTCLVQR